MTYRKMKSSFTWWNKKVIAGGLEAKGPSLGVGVERAKLECDQRMFNNSSNFLPRTNEGLNFCLSIAIREDVVGGLRASLGKEKLLTISKNDSKERK